ncbi:MAG: nucleoside hydrolase-like domain-containing protein, partial [Planctomycetota bacterium]
FADDVLTMKPDVVFIDYCLNDRVIGVEAATQNWIEMIQQAQANNVKVVLLTPTPDSHENILDPNAKLAAHAAAVRKLGQRFGVPVVDSYQAFATLAAHGESVKDYLSQPNHPNRKGHQVVADLLLELFETTSKVIESPENGVHQKSRLIVMADMGNEPDEMQQMMHLLMYSNRVDLEGLIACSGKYLHADRTDGRTQVHPELFHHLVDGYEQVVDKLRLHAADWPGPEYLRSIIKGGSPAYGIQAVEVGRSNEASKLIEASILKDDPRDLYIVGNAGTNTLAQALVDLDRSRTEDEMRRLCSNIIVFENGAQDNSGAWIAAKYPGIRWHRSNHQTYAYGGPGGKNHTAQGPYTWEPFERSVIGQNQWAEQHVMMDHGELGARFPPRIMRERLHFIEGGGTIPWMGLVNHGLTDPGRLHWGGWSGRFSRTRHKNVYSRHSDIRKDEESYDDFQMYEADSEPESWTDPIHDDTFRGRYVPVWRFRRAMFNDFRGRMDWCVNGYEEANHNPVAAVNGDTTNEILRRKAKPGQSLTFDAAASSDPDGDELEFRWWIYDEAGTARKQIELSDNSGLSTTLTMPDDPPGSQIHLILTVRDQSEIVPMYDYRRVVISVEGEN